MPRFRYSCLLTQCGLSVGDESLLPKLWEKLAEKGMTKSVRKSVIKQALAENVWYPDAKVKPYATLVTMIMARDFKDDTSLSCCQSAARSFPSTPFLPYQMWNTTT